MAIGRNIRIGEAGFGVGMLALGIFIVYEMINLHVPPTYASVGPKLFPYLVATGLIVTGALMLRQAILSHVVRDDGVAVRPGPVILISAGLIAQMLLLDSLGWVLATAIVFAAGSWAFGSRRLALDVTIGIVLAAVMFVVFDRGLGLHLPLGIIGESLVSI